MLCLRFRVCNLKMLPVIENPRIILLLSGKRKCGKDFISEKLKSILDEDCTILRISEPIKKYYAEKCGVSLNDLLGDGHLKEKYRKEMIVWGEHIRSEDPGYFCKIVCDNAMKTPFWIVADVRRQTDVNYFKKFCGDKVRTVRINATVAVRKSRGWEYTNGVDDVESECDLDDFQNWDLEISNDGTYEVEVDKILELLK